MVSALADRESKSNQKMTLKFRKTNIVSLGGDWQKHDLESKILFFFKFISIWVIKFEIFYDKHKLKWEIWDFYIKSTNKDAIMVTLDVEFDTTVLPFNFCRFV